MSVTVRGITQPVVLCLACAFVAAPAQADCAGWQISADLGLRASRLSEYADSGQRLVRESGTLPTSGLSLAGRCDGWGLELGVEKAGGSRHYQGVTNQQQAAESRSDIAQTVWSGTLSYPVSDRWSLGGRVEHFDIDRKLRPTSLAQGYPERYDYWALSAGLQYEQPLTENWRWRTSAWLGYVPPGRLDVHLPGLNPVRLKLGRGHTLQLATGLAGGSLNSLAAGWSWSLLLGLRTQEMQAGEPQRLYQGMRLVGTVRQPKMREWSADLRLKLQYGF